MEIDSTGLQEFMDKLAEAFGQVFLSIFNNSKSLIEDTINFLKHLNIKKKLKFKPVLKIKPNKLYYQDRTLKNYYCRNNC